MDSNCAKIVNNSKENVNRLYNVQQDLCERVHTAEEDINNIVDILEECCPQEEYCWFLETGTGPTGNPISGPFKINNLETVRLHSESINITAQTGSVLVDFEVKGGVGVTGPTGQQGVTGAPFASFLGCGLAGDLGLGGTVETDLKCAEIAFVDGKLGNDGTAVVADICRPFRTIQAAILAATPLGTSTLHSLVYVKPWTYFNNIQIADNVDVYCEPGVVINDGFVNGTAPGANFRVYGKAIFRTVTGGLKFMLNISQPCTFYFEFLESRYNTLFSDNSFIRCNGLNGTINATIRGNSFESSGSFGGGMSFSFDVNLDLYIKEKITSFYNTLYFITIDQNSKCLVRCPNVRILEGGLPPSGGFTVSQLKVGLRMENGSNGDVDFYGNVYSDVTTLATGISSNSDYQGCACMFNPNQGTLTINGNLYGGVFRAVNTATTNRSQGGRMIINGSVTNNADSIFPAIYVGWNSAQQLSGPFIEIIVNDGYIQGGGQTGPVSSTFYGTVHIFNGVKMSLNNCMLKSQQPDIPMIVGDSPPGPTGAVGSWLYMYNCVGDNSSTGPTGTSFIYMTNPASGTATPAAFNAFGIIDTNVNNPVGGPGTIPTDVWSGYNIIPTVISPTFL